MAFGRGRVKFLSRLSNGMLFLVISFLVILFGSIIFFATQIPSPNDLTNRATASSTKIFDQSDELFHQIRGEGCAIGPCLLLGAECAK